LVFIHDEQAYTQAPHIHLVTIAFGLRFLRRVCKIRSVKDKTPRIRRIIKQANDTIRKAFSHLLAYLTFPGE
jgi:hypothetical protein